MSENKESLKPISIKQLEVGMFVCELDIPWIESPFLNPYRHIQDEKDIYSLRGCGVKQLIIDLSKSTHQKNSPESAIKSTNQTRKPSDKAVLSVSQELKAASKVRDRARQAISSMNADIKQGKAINTEALTPVVDQTIESLARNNQALMTLLHMNNKASKLADHSFSVMCLCLNLAIELELSSEQIEDLSMAALLHDAGWQKLPLNLMGKRTKYSASETKLVQHHIKLGLDLLKKIELNSRVKTLILQHHERGDGSGFPQKLKQSQLDPLSAILIPVVYYDELVHHLTDQPGATPNRVLQKMYSLAQKKIFDAKIIGQMIHLLGVYPISSAVKLSTGEKAIVIEQNHQSPNKPVVNIMYDKNGNVLAQAKRCDLSESNDQSIIEILDAHNPQIDPQQRLVLS
jgi:putative nucleotidyltransferase with HDIG domain